MGQRKRADGSTEDENRRSAEAQIAKFGGTATVAIKDDVPLFVWELTDLWSWFLEVSQGRQTGAMGLCGLTWIDVMAWSSLTQIHLEPREVRALFRLDALYVDVMTREKPKQK